MAACMVVASTHAYKHGPLFSVLLCALQGPKGLPGAPGPPGLRGIKVHLCVIYDQSPRSHGQSLRSHDWSLRSPDLSRDHVIGH